MPLQFSLDPQTGVVRAPVTVFNGGKRKSKRKTRKSKTARKGRKATRRR